MVPGVVAAHLSRACTVPLPTRGPAPFHRQCVTYVESDEREALGMLRQLLCSRSLGSLVPTAEAWCQETGAAFWSEVLENRKEFVEAMSLTPELSCLLLADMQHLPACVPKSVRQQMPHLQSTYPATMRLLRASTTELSTLPVRGAAKPIIAYQGYERLFTSSRPHSAFHRSQTIVIVHPLQGLQPSRIPLPRSTTGPVTAPEVCGANVRAQKAYIPIHAWPTRSTAPNSDVANSSQRRAQPVSTGRDVGDMSLGGPLSKVEPFTRRDQQRSLAQYRCRTPPPRSDPRLIRRRIPHAELLKHPFEQELLQHKQLQSEEEAALNSRKAQRAPRRVNAFERIRQGFIQQHGEAIRTSLAGVFGSGMTIRPTPLADHVGALFVQCSQHTGIEKIVPTLHGTSESNYSSIYQHGLLIPGKGNGIRVAHGSVHGLGIYTARLQNPGLSQAFSSGQSLLVCGVLDDARSVRTEVNLGSFGVTAKSEAVKHVGDAVVVFERGHVVPLLEVRSSNYQGQPPTHAQPPGPGGACVKATPMVFIERGKGQIYHVPSRTAAWLPPQAETHHHHVEQKRIHERKVREAGRRHQREEKAEVLG